MKAEPDFLNVDLELWSPRKLDVLIAELGDRVSVLYEHAEPRKYEASFELRDVPVSANRAVRRFVALVEGLTPRSRRLWDGCWRRTFDVGIESAASVGQGSVVAFEPKTVQLAASVGAALVVTCYPPLPEAGGGRYRMRRFD